MSTMSTMSTMNESQEVAAEQATPRTRWAAILWGTLFAALAAVGFVAVIDDERRAEIADWTMALTPATIAASSVLALGVLVLVAGAAGLARRAQRSRRAPGSLGG